VGVQKAKRVFVNRIADCRGDHSDYCRHRNSQLLERMSANESGRGEWYPEDHIGGDHLPDCLSIGWIRGSDRFIWTEPVRGVGCIGMFDRQQFGHCDSPSGQEWIHLPGQHRRGQLRSSGAAGSSRRERNQDLVRGERFGHSF
jgi:hypothetical protein